MNNYSWLEQKLHSIALSSQFLREAFFDVECSLIKSKFSVTNPVFVVGLARSGTTIVLNAIYKSNEFASLSYADMPFILAPNLWSSIAKNKESQPLKERAHGDGIKVNSESPEAFEEVFWNTYPHHENESHEKFKQYVNNICHKYQKNRYLSKNNQNVKRLGLLSSIYNDSVVLIPFRDPEQHVNSLISQHLKFLKDSKEDPFISDYMKWIGHTEFGAHYSPLSNENLNFLDESDPNHWLEQWYVTYIKIYEELKDNNNYHFLSYEKLCNNPKVWSDIIDLTKINRRYDFEFKVSKKNVDLNFNSSLRAKSKDLYEQLNKLSL